MRLPAVFHARTRGQRRNKTCKLRVSGFLVGLLCGVWITLGLPTLLFAQEHRSVTLPASLIKDDLYGAALITPDEGWVVGTFGTVYYTADGGDVWVKQPTGTLAPLFSVSFADAKNGWAVGKGGTILHTTDGGGTWQPQSSPHNKHLFAVEAISPATAWIVGDWGMIATTTDGGATWEDRSLSEDIILYAVDFADAQHGWIAGEVGNLLFTGNGGQSWERRRTATGKSLFGIHVADREHAWAVGLDGEIWQFVDGRWEPRSSGVSTALYDVAVAGSTGWVVGDNGTALATHDGGATWEQVGVPEDLKLFWMHAVSLTTTAGVTRGLIGGANGLLLWTRNATISAK